MERVLAWACRASSTTLFSKREACRRTRKIRELRFPSSGAQPTFHQSQPDRRRTPTLNGRFSIISITCVRFIEPEPQACARARFFSDGLGLGLWLGLERRASATHENELAFDHSVLSDRH
jgi:hypothetical protein